MISSHSSTPTRFLHSLKNLEQSSHSSSSRRKNSIHSQFKSSSSRFSFFNAILTLTISILLIGRVNCQSSSSSSTDMSLPLDLSLPRACTPLNITFPVSDDAFPYTVSSHWDSWLILTFTKSGRSKIRSAEEWGWMKLCRSTKHCRFSFAVVSNAIRVEESRDSMSVRIGGRERHKVVILKPLFACCFWSHHACNRREGLNTKATRCNRFL